MRILLVAVFALVLSGGARALQPDKGKDEAARAKAILILSGCNASECATAKKAKHALATSGLPTMAVAPMPREKHISVLPKDGPPEKMNVDPDCTTGICHPILPGYTRGVDGLYRPNGVAPIPSRR